MWDFVYKCGLNQQMWATKIVIYMCFNVYIIYINDYLVHFKNLMA